MGKRLPKKDNTNKQEGIQITSGKDPDVTALMTALGTLLTGQTNIDDSTKLIVQTKGKGAPKPENKGLLGLLTLTNGLLGTIVGGKDKSFFSSYLNTAKENAEYLKENVLNESNKEIFKKLPDILKNIDKNVGTIVDTLSQQNVKDTEQSSEINIDAQGGEDFSKMIDSLKNFIINDKNKESIEELSIMSKKGGALSLLFENVDELENIDPDFDSFSKQLDKMDKSMSEAVAIGEDTSKEKIQAAMENFGEVAKVILALCAVGVLLLAVGLLAEHIDFAGILKFTGELLLFLSGVALVFVLASNYMKPGSEVSEGIKQFILLVAISAVILLVGALMNKFIPFKDVFEFVGKLGLFLLMLTGVFLIWNKLKGATAEGLKDAIIAVGLSAFILFLGAACFRALDLASIMHFLHALGMFLFGLVIVLLATQFALRVGGGQDMKPLKDALFLVVGAAFIMFLGAAVYKVLDKGALRGFIVTFDLFLLSLVAILTPLIKKSSMWKEGTDVIREIGKFVMISAAVMMIGGGLIMAFPTLMITIPVFTLLLGFFIKKMTKRVRTLIAFAGLFSKGSEVMEEINKLIIISSACMTIGGLLIVTFPDLIWGIPVFTSLLSLMIWGVISAMKIATKHMTIRQALDSFIIMKGLSKFLKSASISFLILAGVLALVNQYGGIGAFSILVLELTLVLTALCGLMILIAKTIKPAEAIKAITVLKAVSIAILMTSISFGILGLIYSVIMKSGGMGNFSILVALVVGTLAILSAGIVVLAYALGNPVTAAFAMIAIGVVLAASAAFAIVAAAMLGIAQALKILSTIKSFDITPLVKGVASLTLLTAALMPLALAMPFILMASLALTTLSAVVSKMAQAVKEYADLKIGIYEGTKLVGYRHLETKDFKEAAKNVGLIVTALTEGIMKAYEAHPEWYGIAGLGSFFNNIFNGGETPLERVIRQSHLLAPLISKIADTIKDYAELKIKTYEGTKHVGYRHLKTKDFRDAANNISLVITTLTEGIMMAYEEHKEWYGATLSMSSFSDWLTGNSKEGTPLERVIRQNQLLAPLISKIGEAIGEIANLKFANRWNEKGEAISYKMMKEKDFTNASNNIVKVITTMSEGIMKVYEAHPDWYGTGGTSIKSFFMSILNNALNEGTPMERVIAHDIKLANLISKVADGIKDYAELKVPIDWNEEGKAIKFRNIKEKDFTAAGDNIVKVMTTLSNGLMEVYVQHPEWYENGGIFGGDPTPMEKVINTDVKLSKLISTVAGAVKDYAQLMIPDDWNEEGKPKHYRELETKDFANAGVNIGLVVTTAALGLMGYYSDGTPTPSQPLIEKYMMKDEDDADEEFERLIDNSQKIGNIISGMADGISKYAKMLVPDQWDPKTGTPIHYVRMDGNMMKDAGEGIGKIITAVANTLVTVYKDNKVMFGWDEEEKEFKEDSPIQHVIDSCVNMGSVISGIADGIVKFAEMKMPSGFDKNGKPTGYSKINETVFEDAGKNIGIILISMGKTFKTVYDDNKEMFTVRMKKEGGILGIGGSEVPAEEMTPFERVVDASVKMTTVIGGMAQALQIFADKKVIGKNDEIIAITDGTIELAKKSITDVLKTVAQTFADLAKGPDKILFASGFMDMIVEPVGQMMNVVSTMAKAIQDLALLKVPKGYDEKGEPTGYRQLGMGDFIEAGINIQLILSAIGNAFMEIANDPRNSWISNSSSNKSSTQKFLGMTFSETIESSSSSGDGDAISQVLNGMSVLATILSVISGCIYGYATLSFPKGTDKEGNVEYSEPLQPWQITKARENIVLVATTLAGAMWDMVFDSTLSWLSGEEGTDKMNEVTTAINTMLSTIKTVIEGVKELTENEAVKTIHKVSKSLEKTIEPLTTIINNIGTILTILFKGNGEKYGTTEILLPFSDQKITLSYSFSDLMNQYATKFEETGDNFLEFIVSIVKILSSIAAMDKPLSDTKPKINSLFSLFTEDIYTFKIHTIIASLGMMLQDMHKISSFDAIMSGEYENESTIIDDIATGLQTVVFGKEYIGAQTREKAQKEIDNILQKLSIYSELIVIVTDTLKRINSNISDVQLANYADFNSSIIGFFNAISLIKNSIVDITPEEAKTAEIIIVSYARALEALAGLSGKSINSFGVHTTQLEKFVKTVNSVKLLNLASLNRFVTSLNQLANKMGNLDNLTNAIANKLTKVLEKLVERLVHAEQTIVKADEVQKRRHELIKKSVEEVSNLMKQPMTVEVQQIGGTTEDATTNDNSSSTDNSSNSSNQSSTDNKQKKQST